MADLSLDELSFTLCALGISAYDLNQPVESFHAELQNSLHCASVVEAEFQFFDVDKDLKYCSGYQSFIKAGCRCKGEPGQYLINRFIL